MKISFFWLGRRIDKILPPHLGIVCFITFLTIYQGTFSYGQFWRKKLGLGQTPAPLVGIKSQFLPKKGFEGFPLGPERDLWPLNYFGYEWLFMRKMLKQKDFWMAISSLFINFSLTFFSRWWQPWVIQSQQGLGQELIRSLIYSQNTGNSCILWYIHRIQVLHVFLDIFTEYRYSIYSLIYSQNTGTHSQLLIHSWYI